jgi:uncharacterized protein YdaU (DUF1376 family)
MNFYPFHVGDYKSHTDHLTPKEDICYRRLLDHYYLHESPIPNDMPAVARHIKMRDSEEVIKAILIEFFELRGEYWHSSRADKEISAYVAKSEKARKSIACRWANTNVLRTNNERNTSAEYERNTSLVYEGITTNTNTITNTISNAAKKKTPRKAFKAPTPEEVQEYALSIGFGIDAEKFCNHYQMRGWLVNRTPMKDWQAAVRTWKSNSKSFDTSIPTIDFVKEV